MKKAALVVAVMGVLVLAAPAGAGEEPSTPKACVRALDTAEAIVDKTTEAIGVAGTGFGLASESYLAILDFDTARLEGITAEIEEGTAEINRLTNELIPMIERYNRQSEKCRSLAE